MAQLSVAPRASLGSGMVGRKGGGGGGGGGGVEGGREGGGRRSSRIYMSITHDETS